MQHLFPRPVHAAAVLLVSLVAFVGAASSGAAPKRAAAPSGLVASYSFDAGGGSTLADTSGKGNNGTISGATWASGKNGGALSFDGVNDFVTVADNASLDLTTGMTLSAWVRPSGQDATWRTVVTKETTGNLTYGLFSNSDTSRPAGIVTIGNQTTQSIVRGPSALGAGNWTHVATTYNGSRLRLWVNGSLVASQNVSGAMVNSSGALKIGGNAVWPEWFAGQIDDLRVYNRALGGSELRSDMATPVSGGGAPAPDTQAPTAPGNVTASGATTTSISLSWSASTDNVGVTGYGLYRNGTSTGSTGSTSTTFSGLTCGTSYTLGVDAVDAAGNRSARTSVNAATAACPPVADTQPPSVPQGMAFGTITETTVQLNWNASTDNVGVAGYRLFRDGSSVATVTSPGYTYTGLACGTSYTFALEAYDAAGNASNRAEATGTTSTAACSSGGGGGSTPPPPPPPPSGSVPTVANLWVDANGGSCVRQATRGGYSDAQACSWAGAYQAAQSGDLILVKGGSYGNVTMPAKRSITVTYQTAAGETATVNDFQNGHISGSAGVDNLTLIGPVNARTFRSDKASNVLVDNWRVDCNGCVNVQIFHLENASNVTVRNSDISDNTDNSLIWINGTDITFENNKIHDAGLRAGSGAHTECLYAWNVTNLTLKRNHFWHCAVMDVFITGSSVANGGYIENNVFEKPWSSTGVISNSAYAFHFRNGGDPSPDPSNWDFRHNTFVGPLSISSENPVGPGGMRIIGNVFLAGAPCGKNNTTYSHNAFVSGACGSNSITHPLSTYQAGFTSTGDPGNYSLTSTSVLRDKGDPGQSPGVDLAGSARADGAPDIGAYEYVGG